MLYRLAVGYETGKRLEVRDSVLYLGDFPVDEYTFTENYYFMGGDNVANSQDSRYFGFIPEKVYRRRRYADRLFAGQSDREVAVEPADESALILELIDSML